MDFLGLAASPDELRAYVDYIATLSPRSTPDAFSTADAELAYYLNSYNALAMYNVIDTGIPRSLASFLKKFTFFYWKKFNVGGEKISLYRYENDVIRTLGDARALRVELHVHLLSTIQRVIAVQIVSELGVGG